MPLDPEYPLERLQYMIEDSGACLLLSHAAPFEAPGELPAGVARWCPRGRPGAGRRGPRAAGSAERGRSTRPTSI
ncbi:hypothetical protein P4233_08805 [Pseudomonas aeruginosa]|nr:hypothetical protein [Pseudomonas aeruginosa]